MSVTVDSRVNKLHKNFNTEKCQIQKMPQLCAQLEFRHKSGYKWKVKDLLKCKRVIMGEVNVT